MSKNLFHSVSLEKRKRKKQKTLYTCRKESGATHVGEIPYSHEGKKTDNLLLSGKRPAEGRTSLREKRKKRKWSMSPRNLFEEKAPDGRPRGKKGTGRARASAKRRNGIPSIPGGRITHSDLQQKRRAFCQKISESKVRRRRRTSLSKEFSGAEGGWSGGGVPHESKRKKMPPISREGVYISGKRGACD